MNTTTADKEARVDRIWEAQGEATAALMNLHEAADGDLQAVLITLADFFGTLSACGAGQGDALTANFLNNLTASCEQHQRRWGQLRKG